MSKIIGVVNEKGGVGKSSVCFNLAWEMMKRGNRVLMVDLDGQRANLTFISGIEKPNGLITMFDVLTKGEDIRKAVLVVEDTLHIVPATNLVSQISQSNCSLVDMKKAMDTIREYYDYILIDVSPTPGHNHALTVGVSDFILITMLPDISSLEANLGITETVRAAQMGPNPKVKVLGIVFNRYTWRALLSRQVMAAAENMAASIGTKVLRTKIRNNVAISEAVGVHEGVTTASPKSNGAEDFKNLATEIIKEVNV